MPPGSSKIKPDNRRSVPITREQGEKALALNPHHVHSYKILAQNYTLQGKYGEAIALLTHAIADAQIDDKDPNLLGRLAVAYALQGDRRAAKTVLQTMQEEYGKKRRHFDYFIAMTYQALGDPEKSLDWLEKAYENLAAELNCVHADPEFATLRTHPRYQKLKAAMKARYQAIALGAANRPPGANCR